MTWTVEDSKLHAYKKEPIAIIGIGCRLPGGVNNPKNFWKLLREGTDAITEVPTERWNLKTFYDPNPAEPGKIYTRWGGFIDGIDQFDAKFFGIPRQEAACMDPQQRVLLEVVWEAIEDAGQVGERLAGTNTGVFIGISNQDYYDIQLSVSERNFLNAYSTIGAATSIVANRISYSFDFHGPSMIVNTGCSSSLVTVHLACQSIWNGDCPIALAGGANVILKPEINISLSKAFLLSEDGRCKSFDAQADGYVRSEGFGIVLLKPLSNALADGDLVYAVILSSTVNQDGCKNGITIPNSAALEAVIREAYNRAGVLPQYVQYVEAQGTGTPVGDVVEAKAIGTVLATNRPPEDYCFIGSVKTNIGHAESAAGIAGLIKASLTLKHCQIPPNLHFQIPNSNIPFEQLQLQVPQTLKSWPHNDNKRRIAGVNSFGIGGTNVHVVLEGIESFLKTSLLSSNTEPDKSVSTDEMLQLFPLSARSPKALQDFARAYLDFLTDDDCKSLSLSDICYTLSLRRSHHNHRLALLIRSKEELAKQLKAFLEQKKHPIIANCDGSAKAGIDYGVWDRESERTIMLMSLSQLYTSGQSVDWNVVYSEGGAFVRLPLYPWQRSRYWHETEESIRARIGEVGDCVTSQVSEQISQHKSNFLQQLEAVTENERRSLLITHICSLIAKILDLESLQQGFFTMGMDSLQSLEFRNQLSISLEYPLPSTLAFDYPTITELVDYLAQTLPLLSSDKKSINIQNSHETT